METLFIVTAILIVLVLACAGMVFIILPFVMLIWFMRTVRFFWRLFFPVKPQVKWYEE